MSRPTRSITTVLACTMFATACGSARQSQPQPAAPSASAGAIPTKVQVPVADTPVEQVATLFGRAAIEGDRETARALMLTHDQLVAFLVEPPDVATYQEEMARFLDGAANEGRETAGGKVIGAKVVERDTLPPNEDLKREVEIAAVKLLVEHDGQQHESFVPFFFIRTDVGWRFSTKK